MFVVKILNDCPVYLVRKILNSHNLEVIVLRVVSMVLEPTEGLVCNSESCSVVARQKAREAIESPRWKIYQNQLFLNLFLAPRKPSAPPTPFSPNS